MIDFPFREATERSRTLRIAGTKIGRGETCQVGLDFSETYLGARVSMPVYVLRSTKPGPRVFLAATIHGDELNGLGVLRELLYDAPPLLARGTLIIVPVVNVYGIEDHTRYLPDRRDLNRSFPGTPEGSISARLANVFFDEIVAQCDLGIDFHTAALRRTNFPNIRADMTNEGTRKLARAFGIELIVHGKGPAGSLRREATNNGVPTIILEAGEVWKIEPLVVEVGVRGILNVLRSLGMVEGEPIKPVFQVAVKTTMWVRAERGGLLSFHARPGDIVRRGESLATNSSIFGEQQHELVSPVDGIVIGMTTMPAVKPGEPVYHIAQIGRATYTRIKSELDGVSSTYVYNRLQEALATNIVVRERGTG